MKEGIFIPKVTTVVPLNWKMKTPPGQVGVLMSVTQHVQKKLITLIIKGKLEMLIVEVKRSVSGMEALYWAPLNASHPVMSQ